MVKKFIYSFVLLLVTSYSFGMETNTNNTIADKGWELLKMFHNQSGQLSGGNQDGSFYMQCSPPIGTGEYVITFRVPKQDTSNESQSEESIEKCMQEFTRLINDDYEKQPNNYALIEGNLFIKGTVRFRNAEADAMHRQPTRRSALRSRSNSRSSTDDNNNSVQNNSPRSSSLRARLGSLIGKQVNNNNKSQH